jgi:hypothetical protein
MESDNLDGWESCFEILYLGYEIKGQSTNFVAPYGRVCSSF